MKNIIVFSLFSLIAFYFFKVQEKTDDSELSSSSKKVSRVQLSHKLDRGIASSVPSSFPKQERRETSSAEAFNQAFPPPEKQRAIAKMIDRFDSFSDVKKAYHVKNYKININEYELYESSYLTHPDDGSFSGDMGEIIQTMYGYIVYAPREDNSEKGVSPLYLDKDTWQPTIITGRLFIQYSKEISGHDKVVARQVQQLGHQVVHHHRVIGKLEIQVRDRSKTMQYKSELENQIDNISVDVELKSGEYIRD